MSSSVRSGSKAARAPLFWARVLILVFALACCVYAPIASLTGGAPLGPLHGPIFSLGLMGWALMAATAAHELGHLIGGKLAGMRFLLFRVVPLCLTHTRKGWRWSLSPALGQCLVYPPEVRDLRRRFLWWYVGGPTLGLLAVAACGVLSGGAAAPRESASSEFLWWTAALGLVLNLLSLVAGSDGQGIRLLLRGGPHADQFIAVVTVHMLDLAGWRFEEMDPSLREGLSLPASSPHWGLLGAHNGYFWHLSLGRPDDASPHLTQMEMLAASRPAGDHLRANVALEQAFFAAQYARDAESAQQYLARSQDAMVWPCARCRSAAAVLLVQGRREEAKQIADRGLQSAAMLKQYDSNLTNLLLRDLHALREQCL